MDRFENMRAKVGQEIPGSGGRVSISPKQATVEVGQSLQFTAVTSGGTPRWNINGNQSFNTTISRDGVLHVGEDESSSSITITATAGTEMDRATINIERFCPIRYYTSTKSKLYDVIC